MKNNLSLYIGGGLLSLSSVVSQATLKRFDENRILVKGINRVLFNSDEAMTLQSAGALQFQEDLNNDFSILRYSSAANPVVVSEEIIENGLAVYAQPDYLQSIPNMNFEGGMQGPTLFETVLDKLLPFANDPTPVNPPTLPNPGKSDPLMKEVWGLAKIQVDKIWNSQVGSEKIIVADIDTGVDYNHPDLINNIWRNPKPTMNDVVGYDFANNDPLPFDDFGHGTHTAGTIGATGKNGIGIVGVNHRVSIMILKFLGGPQGQGTTSDAVKSIDYAVKNGARVINASWGGYVKADEPENQALIESIERAEKANVLFVAAAGNDGRDIEVDLMLPGGIENPAVLTVASTNSRDVRSFFSNYSQKKVHVGAPGSDIFSTVPGNAYKKYSGTSMATPHVAGLAALLLAERPELSAADVKEIIESTVDPIETLKGKIKTGGRINARAAMERARVFGI
jgi:subtilisin family serine protease